MGQPFSAMADYSIFDKPKQSQSSHNGLLSFTDDPFSAMVDCYRVFSKTKPSKSVHNRLLNITSATLIISTLATVSVSVLVYYRTRFHDHRDDDDDDEIEKDREDQEEEKRLAYPSVSDLLVVNKTPNMDFIFNEGDGDERQREQKILLVGEEDFSFSASLASSSRSASNMVTTSLNSRVDTSKDAWDKLALAFAKPSHPRLNRLHEKLIRAQGSRSITDYLNDVKSAADELALLDVRVSDDDLTIYIINGLSPDFETISAAFRSRDTPIRFEELYDKLIGHENYRKRTETKHDDIPVTMHAANRAPSSPSKATFTRFHQSKSSAPSSTFKGRNHQFSTTGYKGRCQLCSQLGHSARFCHLLKQQWTYTPTQQPNSFPWFPSPQAFHSGSILGPPPSAPLHSSPWLIDSGASHHITNDPQSLSLHSKYDDPNEIAVGNGNRLKISHTGSSDGQSSSQRTI